MSILQKSLCVFLFFLIVPAFAGTSGINYNLEKQSENAKILQTLVALNSTSIIEKKESRLAIINELANSFEDPYLLAKVMVFAYYLSYPSAAETIGADAPFSDFEDIGFLRLKELKLHKNFVGALRLMKNSIRMDAGYTQKFYDVIISAKTIKEIKEEFPEIIEKYGSVKIN